MQDFDVTLSSEVATSYRCTRAANALDIDQKKKAVHHLRVVGADLDAPYSVGVIVGASGSGKTTLAQQIWGKGCTERTWLDLSRPVIDQFDESMTYDDCAAALAGVGLTAVPCWIRPAHTLSNGQRVRAEAALAMLQLGAEDQPPVVIDEWTSVVDRTVAKVMSHCVQKHARKQKRRVVLLTCHYDVLDWLNPDWIIDCNEQKYIDRRLLCRSEQRRERLTFDIRQVGRDSWRYFSKYHYLSDRLPGGHIETYGLFLGANQIGFQCFANYVPHRDKNERRKQMHSNRTVIHPDYAGLGLGILLINETSRLMAEKGFDVRAKFSSTPVFKAMSKFDCWKLLSVDRDHKIVSGGSMMRMAGFRLDVKTYSFRYVRQSRRNADA